MVTTRRGRGRTMVTTRRGRSRRGPVRLNVFQSSIATTSGRGRGRDRYQISSNANASEPNLNPCGAIGGAFSSRVGGSSSLGAVSFIGGGQSGGGPNPDPDSDLEYVPSQPSDDGSPSDPKSLEHNPPAAEHVAVNDYVSIGSWKNMKDYFQFHDANERMQTRMAALVQELDDLQSFRDANERMQTRMAALVQELDDLQYFSRIGNEHEQFYFDSFFHQDCIRVFDSSDVDQVRKVVQMGYGGVFVVKQDQEELIASLEKYEIPYAIKLEQN